VFLLSACTLFQNGESQNRVAISQAPFTYHANIGASKVDTNAHYSMGVVLQNRHKHRLAVTEFEAALQQDPSNVSAYNGLGISLDAMGEYDRAQAVYLAALAIDPHLGDVINNLGYSYLLQSRFEMAVTYFKRALAIDAENERYRKNLGLAYVQSGNDDAAFATFLSAGDEAEAHMNMARICYREGNYDSAALHFSKAANIKPSDPVSTKGFVAANSLARIHSGSKEKTAIPEQERQGEEEYPLVARYDEDGFATIPAGAIEDLEIIEIDQVETTAMEGLKENENDPPIYTVSLAQADPTEANGDALRENLSQNRRKILDESSVPEVLALDNAATQNLPGTRVKIEVSNGNGVRHMAKNVGKYLTGKGFALMYLSNADHFNHLGTSIYYTREYLGEAYRLSQELPGLQRLEEVPIVRDGHAEISVLIGKDLTEHLTLFHQG
ncbi:MAG: tetratricopeptide repeat protein, partial [Desulfosarcina sp.]